MSTDPTAEHIDAECVFCRIVSGDAPATFVHRSPVVDIIEPIGPHAPGHVLVIPTWHVQDATTDARVTAAVMAEVANYAASVGPCNVITSVGAEATQSVFHLHVHVVPRGAMDGLPDCWPWIGDSAEAARLREERDGARDQRDDLCELVDHLKDERATTDAALAASLPAEVMLAALVDRGTLKPEAHCAHARAAQADGDYRTYTCADVDASCPPDRLVTPWEVAP